MLKRTAMSGLVEWANNSNKKPLLVKGMRQVGKTTLIVEYAKNHHEGDYIYIDMFDSTNKDLFSLSIKELFETIERKFSKKINKHTLLIIDEVQEAEDAYLFIKRLHDSDYPNNLICSGSYIENIVIQKKYRIPMGCYDQLIITPLSFYEFYLNSENVDDLLYVKKCILSNSRIIGEVHRKLLLKLDDFLIIGGMPGVVKEYVSGLSGENFSNLDDILNLLALSQREEIIRGLSKPNERKVLSIYNSIPSSLTKTSGTKMHKLKYVNQSNKKVSFSTYAESISILTRSRILLSIKQSTTNSTIIDYQNNSQKLVYSDTGFLSNAIGMSNTIDIVRNKKDYKGYITENYVATELSRMSKNYVSYWYAKGNQTSHKSYEVDFIHTIDKTNIVVPIEVKSGINVKSISSLNKYTSLYNPEYIIILSGRTFSYDEDKGIFKIPLYAIWIIDELIKKHSKNIW